jgi:hypothetical protein
MDSADPSVRLRLSPLGYLAAIVAGVLLLTMIGLLILQLAVLKDSREHIQAQDHKIAQIQHQTDPLIADAKPALAQAEPLLRRARRLLTPAGQSFETITTAADAVPRLVAGADLLLTEAIPLLQALNATDAPRALAEVGVLADGLTANDRAVRAIDATNRVLAEIESNDLIPRTSRALPRFEDLLVEIVQIQRTTLHSQRLSLRTQRRQANLTFESIRIQRELLDHTRSIDSKIPPPATAPTATPVAP